MTTTPIDKLRQALAARDSLPPIPNMGGECENTKTARLQAGLAVTMASLEAAPALLAEVARVTEICRAAHDGLLRGDDDRELLALLETAWKEQPK